MKISVLMVSFVAWLIAACSAPMVPLPVSITAPATLTNLSTANPSGTSSISQPTVQNTRTSQSAANATTTPTSAIPSPSVSPQSTARPVGTNTVPSSNVSSSTKTYVNTKLQIAVDYPSDWSVRDTASGASFTSLQGAVIDLAEMNTNNQTPEQYLNEMDMPNTRCTTITNPFKLTVRNCLDTIALSYNAYIILKLPNNATRLVTLITRAKGINPVFDAMIASARLVP